MFIDLVFGVIVYFLVKKIVNTVDVTVFSFIRYLVVCNYHLIYYIFYIDISSSICILCRLLFVCLICKSTVFDSKATKSLKKFNFFSSYLPAKRQAVGILLYKILYERLKHFEQNEFLDFYFILLLICKLYKI